MISRLRWFLLAVVVSLWILPSARPVHAGEPISWGEPLNLTATTFGGDYPRVLADRYGNVHVFWGGYADGDHFATAIYYARWDGSTWSEPMDILISPDGLQSMAMQPSISVGSGDRLHIVWTGGWNGIIYYSSAPLSSTTRATGWSKPIALSPVGDRASWPAIGIGIDGRMHVVYNVSSGSGQGIYHVRSADGGSTWSAAGRITGTFQNTGMLLGDTRLAVAADGSLHVVWMWTTVSEPFPPKGILYVRSTNSGDTWEAPFVIADGPFQYPTVAVMGDGVVHLVWSGTAGQRFKFHAWSPDGGQTWSPPSRIGRLGGFQGYAGTAVDSAGILHLALVGSHPEIGDALFHTQWDGGQWSEPQAVIRNPPVKNNLQYADIAISEGNSLNLVVMLPVEEHGGYWRFDIVHVEGTGHSPPVAPQKMPEVAVVPSPTLTPKSPAAPAQAAVSLPLASARTYEQSGTAHRSVPNARTAMLLSLAPPLVLVALALAIGVWRRGQR